MDAPAPALGFVPAVAQFEMTNQAGPLAPAATKAIIAAVAREFASLAGCPVQGVAVASGDLGPVGLLVFPREQAEPFALACAGQGLDLVRVHGQTAAPPGALPWRRVDVEKVVADTYGTGVAVDDIYMMRERPPTEAPPEGGPDPR